MKRRYTGFKDVDDNKIYESDILVGYTPLGTIIYYVSVEFHEGEFCLEHVYYFTYLLLSTLNNDYRQYVPMKEIACDGKLNDYRKVLKNEILSKNIKS